MSGQIFQASQWLIWVVIFGFLFAGGHIIGIILIGLMFYCWLKHTRAANNLKY